MAISEGCWAESSVAKASVETVTDQKREGGNLMLKSPLEKPISIIEFLGLTELCRLRRVRVTMTKQHHHHHHHAHGATAGVWG